jgi:hypothetical protein
VVIADWQGERYLVSMLGETASWVRNVRAAGGRAVIRHGKRETVLLEDVAVESRPPILRRYLALAPGARPHISVDRHAPLEEFEAIAPQIPVFRIAPVPAPGHTEPVTSFPRASADPGRPPSRAGEQAAKRAADGLARGTTMATATSAGSTG